MPYENGQFTLTFNLYNLAVGGSTIWTERHENVGVINGMVNVFLGSIAPLPTFQPGSNPPVSTFATTKYLGITVDADGNPATADPETALTIGRQVATTSPYTLLSKPYYVSLIDAYTESPYLVLRIRAYVYDHRFEPAMMKVLDRYREPVGEGLASP